MSHVRIDCHYTKGGHYPNAHMTLCCCCSKQCTGCWFLNCLLCSLLQSLYWSEKSIGKRTGIRNLNSQLKAYSLLCFTKVLIIVQIGNWNNFWLFCVSSGSSADQDWLDFGVIEPSLFLSCKLGWVSLVVRLMWPAVFQSELSICTAVWAFPGLLSIMFSEKEFSTDVHAKNAQLKHWTRRLFPFDDYVRCYSGRSECCLVTNILRVHIQM